MEINGQATNAISSGMTTFRFAFTVDESTSLDLLLHFTK